MNIDATIKSASSMSNLHSPIGSPVGGSTSNIRGKVRDIQKQLHSHHNQLEETNIELKRVRQMLDPLRLSMKRYTDSCEDKMMQQMQKMKNQQGEENQRIGEDITNLKNENNRLKQTVFQMQQQMDNMANSIAQLQGQVFGNYDSDADTIDKTNAKNYIQNQDASSSRS